MIPKKVYISVAVWDEGRKYDFLEVSERPHQTTDTQCHLREYTDLSQVWHDVSKEPQDKYYILSQRRDGTTDFVDYGCVENYYRGWKSYIKEENIVSWAYIKDLLPKGGEK